MRLCAMLCRRAGASIVVGRTCHVRSTSPMKKCLPKIFLPATSLAILKLKVCMRPKNIHENARGFIQFQEVLPSRVKTSTYYDWFAIEQPANLITYPQITADDGRR